MGKNNFVFVTPAYNCQDKIRQTIKTVYAQSHSNWRMVVYDDMSTDNTAQVVEDMSRQLALGDKLSVVSRSEKYGEVRNTLNAVKSVDDNEIVCRLDGGDWLTETDGLAILDQAYSQTNAAIAWTAHRWAYTNRNISGPLDVRQNVYKHPWVSSHLKTFRKEAINNINKQNFLDDDGNYIMIACDQAIFLPMINKAIAENKPCIYIPLVMYHYDINLKDPELFTKDRSIKQKVSAEWIRARGYIEQ